MTKRTPSPAIASLARQAIEEWGRGRESRAVLVRGSSGVSGTIPLGGDLDLMVITHQAPEPDWFSELRIDGVPVEIFVRDEASMADMDGILRHQSLPFELVENIALHDPHGLLAQVRDAIRPHLHDPHYVHVRALVSLDAARERLVEARALYATGHAEAAAQALSITLWHGAAAAAAAAHRRPTTRRCLAVWAEAIKSSQSQEELSLLRASAGTHLSKGERDTLAKRLAVADDRVADAVQGMVETQEERWVAFPLLRSALWPPASERHSQANRATILAALQWDASGLPDRLAATRGLVERLGAHLSRPPGHCAWP